jgi:predicted phage terminase large subunit-like protein
MMVDLTDEEYRLILQRDFMTFIERSFLELNPEAIFHSNWHLRVLAAKLELCRQGKLRRLIVNLPPRSLKSHTVSVAFVAWLLGHDPSAQIICASYGQDLADKLARDCRTLMLSSFYQSLFTRTRLSPDKQSVNDFTTTRQGFRMSTSVGGVLTGRGADIIILDDPLKPDDALSETRRKGVNDWYDNTLLSRLNNKEQGVIIIVMQRVHQDDLVGHVLEQEGWDVLSFPAIAEVDETFLIEEIFGRKSFQRQTGEPLHAARESLETLAKIRGSIGEYNFSSQYQQRPIPLGGALIKQPWLRRYEPGSEPKEFSYIVQSWDTANKAGELNDYSVCTTWGVHQRRYFYLLNVYRRRMEFPDLLRAVKEQARRYDPRNILIEDKASGTQLIQALKAEGVYCVTPHLPQPGADKVMRVHSQTAEFESGHVLIPSDAPWLDDYVSELLAFPGGHHDDQVDSTTQALEYMTSIGRVVRMWDVL